MTFTKNDKPLVVYILSNIIFMMVITPLRVYDKILSLAPPKKWLQSKDPGQYNEG